MLELLGCLARVPGLTFLPPGEEASGGGVLVMFSGLEPQLEGEDPRILSRKRRASYNALKGKERVKLD